MSYLYSKLLISRISDIRK